MDDETVTGNPGNSNPGNDESRKFSQGKNVSGENNIENENSFLLEDELQLIKDVSNETDTLKQGQGPLDATVIERSYTKRQFSGDTQSPIPEPDIRAQVIDSSQQQMPQQDERSKEQIAQEILRDKEYSTNKLLEKDIPKTGGNPATQNMTKKEREENLELTVTSVIEGYSKIKLWIAGWLTISDAKLIRRQQQGKTPPDWAVLYDSQTGESMTLREFILEGNKRIEKAAETSEDFKTKIRPILIAEFDRRNWILSPQQNGLFLVGTDLINMTQKLITVAMNMNSIMNKMDKEFEEFTKGGFVSARSLYNMDKNFAQPQQPQQPYKEASATKEEPPHVKDVVTKDVTTTETKDVTTTEIVTAEDTFEPPTD